MSLDQKVQTRTRDCQQDLRAKEKREESSARDLKTLWGTVKRVRKSWELSY